MLEVVGTIDEAVAERSPAPEGCRYVRYDQLDEVLIAQESGDA